MHQKASFFRILCMDDKISQQFIYSEPPTELYNKVIQRLAQERKISAIKKKLIFSVLVLFTSLILILPLLNNFKQELSQSGFWNYLSLFYFDLDSIVLYWQDFSLIILETLPALSLACILTMVFLILLSTRLIAQQIKNLNSITHLLIK